MKIALLLPTSDMFPTLGRDFLNGFKLVPNQKGENFKFIIESIGKAADDEVLKIADKLLLQEEVDLTISFCSVFQLEDLVIKFGQYKSPLIFVDLGGSLPKKAHFNPYVLHHSLHLCNSAYTAGQYAAERIGKKGALISSFYDGGYQLAASFVVGFTDNGGEMVYNHVGSMDYKTTDYKTVFNNLKENGAEVAFTLFSYKEAQHFLNVVSKVPKEDIPQFMASPLMTDENIGYDDYGLSNILSVASWSFNDETESMRSFLNRYEETYPTNPNIFSLLGFETALLASKAYTNGKIEFDKIKGESLDGSPRAQLIVNQNYQTEIENHVLHKFKYNGEAYQNTVIEKLKADEGQNLVERFEDIPYTGWKNPYICT